ncbi:MAG: O-antigen ligase family protein [Patescibacteria group bacterium]
MIKKILNNKFYLTLMILLPAELLSFSAHYFDVANIVFLAVFTLILLATLHKLAYGLLIALVELIIGSMGYLFYFDFGEAMISIRMGIWLIVLSVWTAGEVKRALNKKNKGVTLKDQFYQIPYSIKNNYQAYFFVLFFFIAWGGINGYLSGNGFGNLFPDINSYFYFALILPVYSVLSSYKKSFPEVLFSLSQVFLGAVIWMSLKTLFLLYIFSHNLYTAMDALYQWVRDTGVGEITEMSEGVYRIFFQSHIFSIIGFFVLLFFLNKYLLDKKTSLKNSIKERKYRMAVALLALSCMLSVVIIGFSRSFWVGFLAGMIMWLFFTLKQYGPKRTLISAIGILLAGFISLGLIASIVNFPYPEPGGRFDAARAASSRAKQTTKGEAAVSSRWSLLPKLWNEIKDDPIPGRGYGATITYTSSDPRVLERTSNGRYTTFAFEWGWLDIWLKIGIFGLMTYMAIMGKLFLDGYSIVSRNRWLTTGLITGVIILAAVNFFTPFLNHPLGIGYLIITAVLLDKFKGNI